MFRFSDVTVKEMTQALHKKEKAAEDLQRKDLVASSLRQIDFVTLKGLPSPPPSSLSPSPSYCPS